MHPQLLSPEATADWPSAISIRDRVRNLVILPRQPPTWISEALDALPEMALPEIEMSGNVESIGRRAALHIASELPGDLGSWLAADVRMLLGGWALVARETRCLLRLEAVGTDACSKFHTDMVRIRLLCTYRGQGSEWVPDEQVRRSRLGPLGENEDIVPNSAEIRRVPRFAVALLKGDAYDPHTPGVVHRSPSLAAGVPPRLLLRIDGKR